MKNLLYLLLITSLMFSFQSCSDDNDDSVSWRDQNEEAYIQIMSNPSYKAITMTGITPGTIYAKIIESGPESGKSPQQLDRVKVLYKGTYYDGTVFDSGTSTTDEPTTFTVGGVVKGFAIALQHMRPGDRWEIWIPWPLGYGDTLYNNSIPGYSTLVFDVTLVEIVSTNK